LNTVNRPFRRRYIGTAFLALAALCGAVAPWIAGPIFPFGLCAYLFLVLVSGGALYLLISEEPNLLELIAVATALSPVLVATLGTAAMLIGVPPRAVATSLVILSGFAALIALGGGKVIRRDPPLARGEAIVLLALFIVAVAAIGYLPFTREWWRMRADAWFHAAIVAQIKDFGIPPDDPYVAGLRLQYMWFYHVFVFIVSQASGIGVFVIMALANAHALIAFAMVAFLFSAAFKKPFSHNVASTLTTIFGMNAAFWTLLPYKLLHIFTGEVRGAADAARLLNLQPFDMFRVRRFVQMANNQEFLLDKFMVGTAFSLGLCLMALLWYAATRYHSEGRRKDLVLCFLSAFGVMVLHPALGSVVFAGVAGGAGILVVFKRLRAGVSMRRSLILLVALVACGLIILPYLHSVSPPKGGRQAIRIGLSGAKTIGILSSCILVIFLAAFQMKRVVRSRDIAMRFLVWSTAAVIGICTVINLPASNSYDKLPFLVFLPLAVVGGWTIAEFAERGRTVGRRRLRFVLASVIAFGPLNLLMFAGYYHTAPIYRLNANEKEVAAWVRTNTPRDAIIFDTNLRCFLVVAGPRRYFLGNESLAEMWGYDKKEIARRKQIVDELFSPDAIDPPTLEALGRMKSPLLVIVRRDDPVVDTRKFDDQPILFAPVFSSGPISVFEIERSACLSLAGRVLPAR
jgi:hypothetical protein